MNAHKKHWTEEKPYNPEQCAAKVSHSFSLSSAGSRVMGMNNDLSKKCTADIMKSDFDCKKLSFSTTFNVVESYAGKEINKIPVAVIFSVDADYDINVDWLNHKDAVDMHVKSHKVDDVDYLSDNEENDKHYRDFANKLAQ